MSDDQTGPQDQGPEASVAFAPKDYTDNRKVGEWESKYPAQAIKEIRMEAIYVSSVFVLYSVAVFVGLYYSSEGSAVVLTPLQDPKNALGEVIHEAASSSKCNGRWLPASFLGFCCAWAGGGVGGSLYGLKWMYHSVAKRIWHQDRRLWRILTPHISAALATFMVLVISSGLISVFDRDVAVRHIDVLAFSFLVGLFSDKALAKLSEVADTLFGSGKPSGQKQRPDDGQ